VIVVAGEALIDLVPQRAGTLAPLKPVLGGGPYNTAVALGRLGSRTAFCSRISYDAFGKALLDGLREADVDVSAVQRGTEPTTLALATLDENGSAAYSFYVEGTADRLFTAPERLPDGTRAVSFGTCSLVLEPGASAYEELLRGAAKVRGRGRRECLRVAQHASGLAANPFESVLRAIILEFPELEVEPQREVVTHSLVLHPDLVDRDHRFVFEADSFEFHTSKRAHDLDCERFTALALAGWLVIRFSWEQVMLRPEYVREVITRLVRKIA